MSIILIGGPPKCGKTTLAKALSRKLSVPWISADTLQNIAWAYIPEERHAAMFPHSELRGDTNDEFYGYHTAQDIVNGYVEQAKAAYPAIEMMVETYLTDEDDFIVEGYQVTPEIVRRILDRFGHDHIRVAFLTRTDEETLVEDFHKSTTPNDWVLRKTKEEATYGKIAKMIAVFSEIVEREARKYDLPAYNMDDDFAAQLEKVIDELQ